MAEPSKRVKDLRGQKFGRLAVKDFAGVEKNRLATWACVCDCGNTTTVRSSDLTNGHIKSCGCLAKETRFTHGMSKSKLYNVYKHMVSRCYNEKNKIYKHYGGRGIRVCAAWLDNRTNFLDWALSNGYLEGLTLDRIDNDGPYNPENCRWTTKIQQGRNKQNTWMITIDGKSMCAYDYLDSLRNVAVPYNTVRFRIKAGWTLEDATSKPNQRK
jgi:hypothetical protein